MKSKVDLEELGKVLESVLIAFEYGKGKKVKDFLDRLERETNKEFDPDSFYDYCHTERLRAQNFADIGSTVTFRGRCAKVTDIGETDWIRHIRAINGKTYYVHIKELGYPEKPLDK